MSNHGRPIHYETWHETANPPSWCPDKKGYYKAKCESKSNIMSGNIENVTCKKCRKLYDGEKTVSNKNEVGIQLTELKRQNYD